MTKAFGFIIAFAGLLPLFCYAEILCDGATNNLFIQRPLPQSLSATFNYKFQIICHGNPDAPTMIFIPGGPGQSSFNDKEQIKRAKRLGYNLILTAPRGVSDNHDYFDKGGKAAELNSEMVADDIAAIVQTLGLKNYSLYGHSYGTVVATIANKKISDRHLPKPKATILEGVVAKAMTDDQILAEEKAFARAKKQATESGRCLDCELQKIAEAHSLNAKNMGNILGMILTLGEFSNISPDSNLSETDKLHLGDANIDLSHLIAEQKNGHGILSAKDLEFYNAIACPELFKRGQSDNFYIEGDIYEGGHSCSKEKSLSRPYNSKDWQITSEQTYYISGARDVWTPIEHAKEHYSHQEKTNKNFVCIPKGGHESINLNLSSRCGDRLILKMLQGQSITAEDKSYCGNRISNGPDGCEAIE